MARQEHDREDLLGEAVALVERIELRVPEECEQVVVGFRRDGSASFYFGAEPVYQFNASGELRRAFVKGLLFKAERGRIIELRRERTAGKVILWRRELLAAEQWEFAATMHARLNRLRAVVLANSIEIAGQVPEQADLVGRVRVWLERCAGGLRIASTPRASPPWREDRA